MNSLQERAISSALIEEHRIVAGTHNSSWDLDPDEYSSVLLNFFDKVEKKDK